MTIREISDSTNTPIQTVHDAVDRVLPGIKKNGVTTYLDERQVALVSAELKRSHNTDLMGTRKVVTTELERVETIMKAMEYLKLDADTLRAQLVAAAPKIECAEALMRSERTMSITDAAKHFGLHPKGDVFPYLRDRGYLTMRDLPTQAALDAGYLSFRETKCPDGEVRGQAVVEVCQLETWRTRVIPQIQEWKAATA